MTEDVLLVDDPAAGVRRLTLNRPHRLNALDGTLVDRLIQELRRAAEEHPDVRVIVLCGSGSSFSSGADLKWLSGGILDDSVAHVSFQERLGAVCRALTDAPQATIASVHGYVLAGGLEVATACDIIITAHDARLGDQHIRRGLLPGAGGSQRLPRSIGRPRALFYLLTGRQMTGEEAAAYGLAAISTPRTDLHDETLELARELSEKDGYALSFMKQMVNRGTELPLNDALAVELFLLSRYRATSSTPHGAAAAFAQRSQARTEA